MLANDEQIKAIEEAISAGEFAPGPSVLTGYVVVTEWASSDGETYLVELAPETQAYWRTLGLIEASRASAYARVRIVGEDDEE